MLLVNLDLSKLINVTEALETEAKKALQQAGNELSAATYAYIADKASEKLHSRRMLFLESLSHHQVDENTWVVNLDAKAVWIDEGMAPHSQLPALLNSPKAKVSADGSRYTVVPFRHGPAGKDAMTPAQATLLATVKSELRKRKIPYAKIEKDEKDNPKLGKLHSFNIGNKPTKLTHGRGMGAGPFGQVAQGPTGIPLLQGISIYQTKGNRGGTKRSIMTFRVASEKHVGKGRWDHPGLEATHLMDDGAKWAAEEWEKRIAPQIVAQLAAKL